TARAAATPAPGTVVVRVIEPAPGTAVLAVIEPGTASMRHADEPADPDPTGTVTMHVEETVPDRQHVAVPGDHLWAIAEAELTARLGAPADDAAIERYWRQVILAN